MKRAVAPFCVSVQRALPLSEEPVEGKAARGENAEVSMHREDVFVVMKGSGKSDGNRFLADAAKPFAYLALAEEDEHFFLDHPRAEELDEEVFQ